MNRPENIAAAESDRGSTEAMATSSQGEAALIETIESDAQAEEVKILRDAAEQVTQREQYTDKKIESMLNDALAKAQSQAETIRAKAVSQAQLEIKRRRLQASNETIDRIMAMAEQKLQSMITAPAYRDVLIGWIVEAALGLGADVATLNASAAERALIDETLLNDVHQRLQHETGRSIMIRLADGPPQTAQGVVLATEDGRMAFNNQVKTRLLRQQRHIQRLIHDTLFMEQK